MEDIEAKIDMLLDMYKEYRTHMQLMTSSPADDDRQLSDVTIHRRSACELTSSRADRAKPMLRNFSDLGPRSKKHVTYSTSDGKLSAVTANHAAPCHVTALQTQQQPSIVSEEDEDIAVVQPRLFAVSADDVKSSTSDTSSTDVHSQSELHSLHGHSSVDVRTHCVTPAEQTDFDSSSQLYTLPTYQLTSCNNS